MRPGYPLQTLLRSRVAPASAARFATQSTVSIRNVSYQSVGTSWKPQRLYPRVTWARAACQSATSAGRSFASEADSPKSNVSFQPEEVSRQLVALAEKYCKQGTAISPSQNFESLETREERPWDCLDTVEFVLDAEDLFGVVIPDEAADSFEKIQDVVDFVVKAGGDRTSA